MLSRAAILCLASLLLVGLVKLPVHAAPDADSLLYTVAPQYDPLAWMHAGERFPAGATIFLRDGGRTRSLVPNFSASADPSISFDRERVLFAGKQKPQEPWQIWEIALAEGKPRPLVSCPEGCVRPFYLPEDRVVYARKSAGRFIIEALNLDGGKPLELTHTPESAVPTDILHDGRILFESVYPGANEAIPEIYTVYSDGSGVESYRCDHSSARYQARQVSSGDVIFISGTALAKFTSARAQQVPLTLPPADYAGDVTETAPGDWILPSRPNSSTLYELAAWTPGSTTLRSLISNPDKNVLQPVLVHPRPVPNRHPSALHDWQYANLLCLNAYTSKHKFDAESIHAMRLYTRDESGISKLLGTAPVERDGSFFVQVPGDQPLQIELLDASGKTLHHEKGFFWMRKGEQRVCVGCHAGPETAPENAVPMILLKSTTPADLTGAAQSASGGH